MRQSTSLIRLDCNRVNPERELLQKGVDGLLHMQDGNVAFADPGITVTAGALEQSNVNVAKTLVNMIELARQYEMQVNVIKASKENADAASQIMRFG